MMKFTRMYPLETYDWKFGKRSNKNLDGVNPALVQVTRLALKYSSVDFGITQGLRTEEQQKKLVAEGKSQTMKSRHLTGHAVDVVCYVDGKVTWEFEHYRVVAQAFAEASRELGVPIRWGAAWTDLLNNKDAKEANHDYVALRRSQNRTPFIDGPHFEIPKE